MIPTVPAVVDSPNGNSNHKPIDSPMIAAARGCIEDDIEDSGFMEY
jgi:hypothetical protein